jgi:glyoxalase-like protein
VLTAIDHVIVAVRDVDASAAAIEGTLGLRAGGGGRHDTQGTHNRIFWLGDSYLELMGILDYELASASWWGRHISRLLAQTPAAFAGAPISSDDASADVARLRAQGSAISDPVAGERMRPDGDAVRWRMARLPEPDPELGLLFLIEHDAASAEWRPEDRAARAADVLAGTAGQLLRVDVPVADVARASLRLLRDLGLQFRPSLAGGGARDTSIGLETLRLVPARGDSRTTIVLRAGTVARELDLLGCHWSVLPIIAG